MAATGANETTGVGSRVAAVVLAAGLARRYRAGDPALPTKLVAEVDGVPVVRRVAVLALASEARPVVVVTGHAARDVELALHMLPVQIVANPDYASGLASSIKRGLAAVPAETEGVLVLLGDMPGVRPSTVDRLIDAFLSSPGAWAAVPSYGGRRGNPALIGRALFASAMRLEGDEGARRLLSSAETLDVPVDDRGIILDLDHPRQVGAFSSQETGPW